MKTKKVETALVIGGASGMGRAVSIGLASLGIHIYIADLDASTAKQVSKSIRNKGGTADAFRLDISQSTSVHHLFKDLKEKEKPLDLMVHTAAILGNTMSMEDTTDELWHRMTKVNLDGVFFCCREAVRWMKEQQSGRIILFGSIAGMTPTPGAIAYSVMKSGVHMLGKTLAREVAGYNIRVNVIAPGYIQTPMLDDLPENYSDYVIRNTPIKRFGEVTEIAALVNFLASAEADFFTGQILSPNGGLVI